MKTAHLMNRIHVSESSISDLTQSTLIFGGLCLAALHFGSVIDTPGRAVLVEEVKVAQYEHGIGTDTPDILATCMKKSAKGAAHNACKKSP